MMAVDQMSEVAEALDLIRQCLAGSVEAAGRFQERYGELIYGYPMRVYRVPPEDAGDFYVFAFEKGRIFRRLQTFEGRAPLRAYLLGFVLNDLVLAWKRGQRELETVSLDAVAPAGEVDPALSALADGNGESDADASLTDLLADLGPSKTAMLKLLYVEDCDLTPEEIRYLSETSGRSVAEVVCGIEALRATVRDREIAVKQMEDTLDGVQSWIRLYQRRLREIDSELAGVSPSSGTAARLQQERAGLQGKLDRRQRQREKVVGRARRRKVTAPYKEIAALLNTSTGNVGSQIARVRREVLEKVQVDDNRVSAI